MKSLVSQPKKALILLLLLSLLGFKKTQRLSAQETLSTYNTSWTSVLPGIVLSEPAVTSYGFCLATDARNLMGYSSTGKDHVL